MSVRIEIVAPPPSGPLFRWLTDVRDRLGFGLGTPTLVNGWVNFGAPPQYRAAGFCKQAGIVRLEGTVKDGTGAIFTLPAGFRPAGTCRFAVDGNGAYGCVEIDTAGTVTALTGGNVKLSLDGIAFRAA